MEHNLDEGEEDVANLLDVKTEDSILSDDRMAEYENIEHQLTPDNKSVSEHKNDTSTGKPHRANSGQVKNMLEMSFEWKYYYNVQFTSIS